MAQVRNRSSRALEQAFALALPVAVEHPLEMSGMVARCKPMLIPELLKHGHWVMEGEGGDTRLMKARTRVYIVVLVK